MSAVEIEQAIQKLPPKELAELTDWFEQYIADQWDKKIEEDILTGCLDHLGKKADEDFEAGRCTTL